MDKNGSRPDAAEGECSSTDAAPGTKVKRWSANRKKEAVLRLMRGELVDALSRELGVEIYLLEEWREKALQGIDTALKSRENDPLNAELDAAKRRIGEISMENELLREKIRKQFPLYELKNRKEAQPALRAWIGEALRSGLEPFKELASKLFRKRHYILNFFVRRITSAISDGINNKIKRLTRLAYRYRDVAYFLLKIHQHCGRLNPRRFPIFN